jgi:hypothetical protein
MDDRAHGSDHSRCWLTQGHMGFRGAFSSLVDSKEGLGKAPDCTYRPIDRYACHSRLSNVWFDGFRVVRSRTMATGVHSNSALSCVTSLLTDLEMSLCASTRFIHTNHLPWLVAAQCLSFFEGSCECLARHNNLFFSHLPVSLSHDVCVHVYITDTTNARFSFHCGTVQPSTWMLPSRSMRPQAHVCALTLPSLCECCARVCGALVHAASGGVMYGDKAHSHTTVRRPF